jgi:hypothetical protein
MDFLAIAMHFFTNKQASPNFCANFYVVSDHISDRSLDDRLGHHGIDQGEKSYTHTDVREK